MCPESDPSALDRLVTRLGVHQPTAEQAAVIEYPTHVKVGDHEIAAPLLVVAGAGSGKTETMSLRAVYLAAEQGIEDDAILGLTFTRKAAGELEGRLAQRLAQLRAGTAETANLGLLEFEAAPQASTYDAFALDVVREFGPRIGLSTDFQHLDAAAGWQLMMDMVEGWHGPVDSELKPESLADRAISLRQAITGQGLSTAQARRALERLHTQFEQNQEQRARPIAAMAGAMRANTLRLQLLDIIDVFDQEKAALGRLDFADQTILATKIIEAVPGAKQTLRERHRIVFLDEFQDTSVAQMRFLSALFADHPVTAVGDPNQAIYGWRSASAASLEDFHDLFSTDPHAPRTTLNLSVAWRNSLEILTGANAVAADLRKSPAWAPREEIKAPSPILEPRAGAPLGSVQTRYFESPSQEDQHIARFFKEAFEEADKQGDKRPTGAILTRTRARMPALLEALRQAGVPAEIGGESGLLLHPAVADLRAALDIVHDIGRSSQLLRLLGNLDLGAADLYQLGQLARELARAGTKRSDDERPEPLLIEAVDHVTQLISGDTVKESRASTLKLSPAAARRVATLGKQLQALRRAADWTIVEQVEWARRTLGVDEQALIQEDADTTEILDAFTRAASDYQETATEATMAGFLGWLEVAGDKERGLPLPKVRANPDAIQILTVHGAKGLEWDLVAVAGLECGVFPSGGRGAKKVTRAGSETATWELPPLPANDLAWWGAPEQLPFSVREDARHLPAPDVWDPDMKAKDIQETIRQDFGAYRFAEERRLAYVAFTRPKHKLLLTGSWVGTGTTPRHPSPFYTEVQQALGLDGTVVQCPSDEKIGEILGGADASEYPVVPSATRKQITLSAAKVQAERALLQKEPGQAETRIPELLAGLPDQQLARTITVLLAERERAHRWAGLEQEERSRLQIAENRAGLATFTATGLSDLAGDGPVFTSLRRPLPGKPTKSALTGTIFHRWVEAELRRAGAAASDEGPETLDRADIGSLDAAAALLSADEKQSLGQMMSQFRAMEWIRRYRVEGLEVPFDLELGGLLVRGRVDAVLSGDDESSLLLVDWKTGTPPGETWPYTARKEALTRYLIQLETYTQAWRVRFPGTRIDATLVFIGPNSWQKMSLQQIRDQYAQLGLEPLSVREIAQRWNSRTAPQSTDESLTEA